jgi:hypothetical protein
MIQVKRSPMRRSSMAMISAEEYEAFVSEEA